MNISLFKVDLHTDVPSKPPSPQGGIFLAVEEFHSFSGSWVLGDHLVQQGDELDVGRLPFSARHARLAGATARDSHEGPERARGVAWSP